MPLYEHRDIQFAESRVMRDYLRDINLRMRTLGQALTSNRRQSTAEVSINLAGNATYTFLISDADYDIDSYWYYSAGAAGTMTLAIDGVTVGGSAQTPTATAVRRVPTSALRLTSGDRLSVTAAATTGDTIATAVLRRLT